ncbi:hypothetical protein [Aeromonas jandaei]|uniref:hypothetical protein n=1 Tax=Aeromonas jandaei TaxID=650 RepID=UPI003BA32965
MSQRDILAAKMILVVWMVAKVNSSLHGTMPEPSSHLHHLQATNWRHASLAPFFTSPASLCQSLGKGIDGVPPEHWFITDVEASILKAPIGHDVIATLGNEIDHDHLLKVRRYPDVVNFMARIASRWCDPQPIALRLWLYQEQAPENGYFDKLKAHRFICR